MHAVSDRRLLAIGIDDWSSWWLISGQQGAWIRRLHLHGDDEGRKEQKNGQRITQSNESEVQISIKARVPQILLLVATYVARGSKKEKPKQAAGTSNSQNKEHLSNNLAKMSAFAHDDAGRLSFFAIHIASASKARRQEPWLDPIARTLPRWPRGPFLQYRSSTISTATASSTRPSRRCEFCSFELHFHDLPPPKRCFN